MLTARGFKASEIAFDPREVQVIDQDTSDEDPNNHVTVLTFQNGQCIGLKEKFESTLRAVMDHRQGDAPLLNVSEYDAH